MFFFLFRAIWSLRGADLEMRLCDCVPVYHSSHLQTECVIDVRSLSAVTPILLLSHGITHSVSDNLVHVSCRFNILILKKKTLTRQNILNILKCSICRCPENTRIRFSCHHVNHRLQSTYKRLCYIAI